MRLLVFGNMQASLGCFDMLFSRCFYGRCFITKHQRQSLLFLSHYLFCTNATCFFSSIKSALKTFMAYTHIVLLQASRCCSWSRGNILANLPLYLASPSKPHLILSLLHLIVSAPQQCHFLLEMCFVFSTESLMFVPCSAGLSPTFTALITWFLFLDFFFFLLLLYFFLVKRSRNCSMFLLFLISIRSNKVENCVLQIS